jgi:hypothetical protein
MVSLSLDSPLSIYVLPFLYLTALAPHVQKVSRVEPGLIDLFQISPTHNWS